MKKNLGLFICLLFVQQLLVAQSNKLQQIKQLLLKMNNGSSKTEIKKVLALVSKNKDESEGIIKHMDLLNDPYIGRIRSIYPDLSYEDLKLCYYLKLKFSTKEIADKLNLSYRGAETKRYRLRKKMNVLKGRTLIAYLDGL